MTAREIQVTFDCGDPAALAIFWAEALGSPPLWGGHIILADPAGNEFCLD